MSLNKKVPKEVSLRGKLALPRETPFPLRIPLGASPVLHHSLTPFTVCVYKKLQCAF